MEGMGNEHFLPAEGVAQNCPCYRSSWGAKVGGSDEVFKGLSPAMWQRVWDAGRKQRLRRSQRCCNVGWRASSRVSCPLRWDTPSGNITAVNISEFRYSEFYWECRWNNGSQGLKSTPNEYVLCVDFVLLWFGFSSILYKVVPRLLPIRW